MKRLPALFVSFFIGLIALLSFIYPPRDSSSKPLLAVDNYPLYNQNVISISAGFQHTLALTAEGEVFAWGDNTFGQVGNQSATDQFLPTNITPNFSLNLSEKIVAVSAGRFHSLALSNEGRVFAWGYNNFGQLGLNSTTSVNVPTLVSVFNPGMGLNEQIAHIEAGAYHSLALTNDHEVYSWGLNSEGQLGNQSTTDQWIPTSIALFFNGLSDTHYIQALAAGDSHSYALTNQGQLFAWGLNNEGQLGDGTTLNKTIPTNTTSQFLFVNEDDYLVQIRSGDHHGLALSNQGIVFTWGQNSYGQLGNGSTYYQIIPTSINSYFGLTRTNEHIVQLAGGTRHSLAITNLNKIFGWGQNSFSQISTLVLGQTSKPRDITGRFNYLYSDENFALIEAGGYGSFVVTDRFRVFAGGDNQQGQIGLSTPTGNPFPTGLFPTLYKISFYTNGGTAVNPLLEEAGTTLTLPPSPTLMGYTFGGWYTNSALSQSFTLTEMPSNDFSLYAKWYVNVYEITFDSQGGSAVNSIRQAFNSSISAPENPTREGYTFNGWFTDETFETPFTFSKMPSSNLTLYAYWIPIQYQITFETNGGTLINPILRAADSSLELLPITLREGYEFVGWYINASMTQTFDLLKMPAYDITLHAKWHPLDYTITIITNGGTTIDPITQPYGSTVITPILPTREGHTFAGWYEDFAYTQVYVFEKMPAKNTTVFVRWVPTSYSINYVLNGGTNHADNPRAYNITTATFEFKDATLPNAVFLGWYNNSALTGFPITHVFLGTMGDITLYAKWENLKSLKQVIELIDQLPRFVSLTDKETVYFARAGYNSLTESEKALVTNYDALIAAETVIAELEKSTLPWYFFFIVLNIGLISLAIIFIMTMSPKKTLKKAKLIQKNKHST